MSVRGAARPGLVVADRLLDAAALAREAGAGETATARELLDAGPETWKLLDGAARNAAARGGG